MVDGHAIATSQESEDTYGYLRTDPGAMYAPITGYYSVVYGFTGIERSLNDTLGRGGLAVLPPGRCRLGPREPGRERRGATLTDSAAQQAA